MRVSAANGVVLRADELPAATLCAPPDLRRSAGIGKLLASWGINVGMVFS